jgi:hypothetical protein
MDFKQDFLAALQSGRDDRGLLEIVRRHHAQRVSEERLYELLEQIWKEFGFHETEESSPLRDELEYVMERVWYYGAEAG